MKIITIPEINIGAHCCDVTFKVDAENVSIEKILDHKEGDELDQKILTRLSAFQLVRILEMAKRRAADAIST